jgi:hypothetical protein
MGVGDSRVAAGEGRLWIRRVHSAGSPPADENERVVRPKSETVDGNLNCRNNLGLKDAMTVSLSDSWVGYVGRHRVLWVSPGQSQSCCQTNLDLSKYEDADVMPIATWLPP